MDNPLSGERITILDSEGDALVWELVLAPGGRVPSSHAHPHQEERFEVIEGELRLRLGRKRLRVQPGQSVTVPPGRTHHFANRGPVPARAQVVTTPALDMESLLRTAAALAREQHDANKRFPRLVDLALFMREFEAEVAAPWLAAPAAFTTRYLARLASARGRDRRYERLRRSCGPSS